MRLSDVHADLGSVLRALNRLARTGWMLRGIPGCSAETVAQHSFTAAVLALELAWEARGRGLEVDPLKASAIALLHDVAEAWVGDIPKPAGLDEVKVRLEDEAVESSPLSPLAKSLYHEFNSHSTLEAAVARAAELLATHLAATWYKGEGYPVDDILANTLDSARRVAREAGFEDALDVLISKLGLLRGGGDED
jgi:putative hydrolase of HD superfamily